MEFRPKPSINLRVQAPHPSAAIPASIYCASETFLSYIKSPKSGISACFSGFVRLGVSVDWTCAINRERCIFPSDNPR
jgi:hypothetical protein